MFDRPCQITKGYFSALDEPPRSGYHQSMNVYDFDKTIYPVDSTVQFYGWCLARYPGVWLELPAAAWAFFCLGLRLKSKTRCKQIFYRFLGHVPADAPARFWTAHIGDVRPWYLAQRRDDDLIISASPEFLLRPVADALGFDLIASPVEQATGLYRGENCHGPEKVRRFRAAYPDAHVEGFWSDSRSDSPMAALADNAWLVKNGVPQPW